MPPVLQGAFQVRVGGPGYESAAAPQPIFPANTNRYTFYIMIRGLTVAPQSFNASANDPATGAINDWFAGLNNQPVTFTRYAAQPDTWGADIEAASQAAPVGLVFYCEIRNPAADVPALGNLAYQLLSGPPG